MRRKAVRPLLGPLTPSVTEVRSEAGSCHGEEAVDASSRRPRRMSPSEYGPGVHCGRLLNQAAAAAADDPIRRQAANVNVLDQPAVSKNAPPAAAPAVIAHWIVATCRPPPASASSRTTRLSHVPHPTGAAVP